MNQLYNTINNDFSPTNCSMCGEKRDEMKICRKCIGPNYEKYAKFKISAVSNICSENNSSLYYRYAIVNNENKKNDA